MKDFHYVTEALQTATNCIWSLLDENHANNVDDVLALLAIGQTMADEAQIRLITADALTEEAKQAERLLMQLAPLVYKPEIQEHLPYGLADAVKTWVRSSKFDTALHRYLEASNG